MYNEYAGVLLGGKQITFILSQVINDKNSVTDHSSATIIGFLSFYAYRGIKSPKRFSPKRIIKVIFHSAVMLHRAHSRDTSGFAARWPLSS